MRYGPRASPSWAALALLALASIASGESHFAPYAGGRVHYESYGYGREAVVYIHGWTCDLTFWREQAPVYENQRSLLIDLPGHGESDKPHRAYPVEFFARGIEAAMKNAGIERAVLVGHSLGGPIAYTFLRLYPKQVKALVFVDVSVTAPQATAAYRNAQALRYAANRKALGGPGGTKYFAGRIESMFGAHTPPGVKDQIREKMLATPEWVRVAAVASPSELDAPDPDETYPLPVLAIQAIPSHGPDTRGAALHKLFPHVRIENWNGGHFLMMEDPARFNRTLEDFLAALP